MIMLEQMMVLHGCEKEVEQQKPFKLARLKYRLYGVMAPGSPEYEKFTRQYCNLCTSLVCDGVTDKEGREGCINFQRWYQANSTDNER